MDDTGHLETEKLIAQMDKKVAKVYQQAAQETQKKLDDYLKAFEKKDKKKRELLDAGEITQKDYNDWRTGQIMIGKRWEEMRDTLAQDYHNANEIARSVVNGYMPEVYALNHNYGTFQVEKESLVDTSYTLYDRQTVERLMRDDPELLPPPGEQMKDTFKRFDAYKSGQKVDLGKKEKKAFDKLIADNKDIRWQKGQIQSVMTQSILQGESVPHMAQRVARTMGETNRKATTRYVRTAATGAQNAGRVDSYKRAEKMGIELEQEWLATLDNRTRHEHRELDGQHVPVGKPFEVDDEEIRFPGDPTAPGYLIWNCRCTLVPRLKNLDQSDAPRYSNLEGKSYEEWKHEHERTEIPNNTSIGDLKRPVRPRKSEYGGDTEKFQNAREIYKADMKQYEQKRDKAIRASMDSTAFTNFDELGLWANRNGVNIDPQILDHIDIRSFNEVAPTLDEMFRRFPEVKDYKIEGFKGETLSRNFGIGITNDGLLSANGGFNLNPLYFSDYEQGIRSALDGIAEGQFVRGDGSFSTLVRHEYGHNVQDYVESKLTDKYHMRADDWRLHYSTFDEYKDAQTKYRDERNRYEQELLSLAGLNGSSEYSSTNSLELFAEGFAEWSSGSETEFGMAFGKFLKRWY